jgi:hypothetical protein
MAQQLIVEGNDAIALSVLCQKAGLNPPVGYDIPLKYKSEFVKVGNGYNNAIHLLELALDDPNLSNIGIIVDANDAGYNNRWQSIRQKLADKFSVASLLQADSQIGAKIIVEPDLPTIGIWIMPDNANAGYLEHFLAKMIPAGDPLWQHTELKINELSGLPFNELTPTRVGKAKLHTWLSWKKEPGKPFGQAITAGYLPVDPLVVQQFLDWFSGTFELGK